MPVSYLHRKCYFVLFCMLLFVFKLFDKLVGNFSIRDGKSN